MEDVTIKMFPMKKNKIKKDAINHYKNLSEKKKRKKKKEYGRSYYKNSKSEQLFAQYKRPNMTNKEMAKF